VHLNGCLYVADFDNHAVRCLDLGTMLVSTIAGRGPNNLGTRDGPGKEALFSNPQGLAVHADGSLIVCDNHSVRLIDMRPGEGYRVRSTNAEGGSGHWRAFSDAEGTIFLARAGSLAAFSDTRATETVCGDFDVLGVGRNGALYGREGDRGILVRLDGVGVSAHEAVARLQEKLAPCLTQLPAGVLKLVAGYAAWPLCWRDT